MPRRDWSRPLPQTLIALNRAELAALENGRGDVSASA
jgi:hypothetical protein